MFDLYGYQKINKILSAQEVNDLKEFLVKSLDHSIQLEFGEDYNSKNLMKLVNQYYEQKKYNINENKKKILAGMYPPEIRLNERFIEIVSNKNLVEKLSEITKIEIQNLHLPPMARYVLPNNTGAMVPAHQDETYNTHMSNFVTLWITLVEIDNECGGLRIFKHDKNKKVEKVNLEKSKFWYDGVLTENYEYEDILPMSPGDGITFKKNIIHQSLPNISNKIRFSLDLRYFSKNDKSSKPYINVYSKKKYNVNSLH